MNRESEISIGSVIRHFLPHDGKRDPDRLSFVCRIVREHGKFIIAVFGGERETMDADSLFQIGFDRVFRNGFSPYVADFKFQDRLFPGVCRTDFQLSL